MSLNPKVYKVKVEKLVPYANNYNRHSEEQVSEIAKSIERFGFLSPILIDGDLNVVAGHGRIEAAKLLGLETVPAIKAEGLSEADRRAYLIADNHIATHSDPDEEILKIELSELAELEGIELSDIGFSDEELDDIFGEETKPDKKVNLDDLEDTAGEPLVAIKVPERLALRIKSQVLMREPESWDKIIVELENNDFSS